MAEKQQGYWLAVPLAISLGVNAVIVAGGVPEVGAEVMTNTKPVNATMESKGQADLEAILVAEFCPAVDAMAGAAVCDGSCDQIPRAKITCDEDGVRHIHAVPGFLVNVTPVLPLSCSPTER